MSTSTSTSTTSASTSASASASASTSTYTSLWTLEETKALIAVWGQANVQSQLDSRSKSDDISAYSKGAR